MGLYFEEFSVGQKVVTEKRTITENDIMTFAALSGDNNRIHTDPEFSKTTMFGRQVAHGLLGLAVASGLAWQTGILDGTVIAFREGDAAINHQDRLLRLQSEAIHADLSEAAERHDA